MNLAGNVFGSPRRPASERPRSIQRRILPISSSGKRRRVERHTIQVARANDPLVEQAGIRSAGRQQLSGYAAALRERAAVQTELTLLAIGPVTIDTVGPQDRLNVAPEIDRTRLVGGEQSSGQVPTSNQTPSRCEPGRRLPCSSLCG